MLVYIEDSADGLFISDVKYKTRLCQVLGGMDVAEKMRTAINREHSAVNLLESMYSWINRLRKSNDLYTNNSAAIMASKIDEFRNVG